MVIRISSSAGPPDPGAEPLLSDAVRVSLLGHDLRAAVSDIIGGMRLIDQSGLDEPTRVQLERVRAAGETLARLLEDALALFPGEAAAGPGNVQLARFLYDLEMRWSGRAQEKGLSFQIAAAPNLAPVLKLDRIALERVLANILSNAIKYTDAGEVRLQVLQSEPQELQFVVRDQGPGFSEAAMRRLYQVSGRPDDTPKPGQGLGMHISKHMTGRLGGHIAVRNLPQGGAEVTLTLPVTALSPHGTEADAALPDLSQVKILVAEDSASNQLIIGQMLTRMGAQFEIAADGVEALQWLERESFDLLLVDIEMPRLSGIEVIRALRGNERLHRTMPIVAITAYVLRANRDAIFSAGADAILAKPITGIDSFGHAIATARSRVGTAPELAQVQAREAMEMNHARFAQLMEIAGTATALELLERLVSDLEKAGRGLASALTQGDEQEIRAQTHILISVSGAVGAERLQAMAEALNSAAHQHAASSMQGAGRAVLEQVDRLIQFARDEIASREQAP
jgi:CheY-like chemotaxis protein